MIKGQQGHGADKKLLQRLVLQHMEIHAELQHLLRTRNMASSVPVPARILQLWDYEQRQDPQVGLHPAGMPRLGTAEEGCIRAAAACQTCMDPPVCST